MKFLNTWKLFESSDSSIEEIETKFWRVQKYVMGVTYKQDYLAAKLLSKDVIIEGNFEEEFFIYVQSLNIFLIFNKERNDYYITDMSINQNSKPIPFGRLKGEIYTNHVKKMKARLDEVEEAIRIRVDKVKKNPELNVLVKNFKQIPEFDLDIERLNQDFRKLLEKEYLGSKLFFQAASYIFYKPGQKIWIVQPIEVTIDDIEIFQIPYKDLHTTFVNIYCTSPFGQNCKIKFNEKTDVNSRDLENNSERNENSILMLATEKASKYPYSNNFLLSPSDFETIQFCSNVVGLLQRLRSSDDDDDPSVS